MGDGGATIRALVAVDGLNTQFTPPVGKAGTRSTDKARAQTAYARQTLRCIDNNRVVASTSPNHIIVINLAEKGARHLIDFNDEKGVLKSGYGLRVTGTMNSRRVMAAIVALLGGSSSKSKPSSASTSSSNPQCLFPRLHARTAHPCPVPHDFRHGADRAEVGAADGC